MAELYQVAGALTEVHADNKKMLGLYEKNCHDNYIKLFYEVLKGSVF
jgi:hypothetical protein